MAIRSRLKLLEDQAAMLDELRRSAMFDSGNASGGRPAMLTSLNRSQSGAPETPDVVTTIGKVTGIVTSDATHGPHLTVRPQHFTGAPPVAIDADKPILRAYPTPNRVVGDYAVNEYVILATVRGGLLAIRLG